jgi:hypothetical protein
MSETPASEERPRNIAYARVWTAQSNPILPAELADELTARGFVPGFTDPEGAEAPMHDAGLAEARFVTDAPGFRILSMSSSKGGGCLVSVHPSEVGDLPDDYLARRRVPKPRLCYRIQAAGPSHSDRNLCEAIAELLLVRTDGVAEVGGRGVKGGNRPVIYDRFWQDPRLTVDTERRILEKRPARG